MWFGVQTSPEGQAQPTTPVTFDIDWVKEYAYDAASPATPPTAPTVTTPPSASFVSSGTIASDAASAALPVSVGWAAKAGSSAVCQQALTRTVAGSAPVAVKLSSPTATTASDTIAAGQTLSYSARATGCDGLASPATAGPVRSYKVAQEGSFAGSWSTLTSSSAFSGGSIKETYASGASESFYMGQAAAIALVGERGPHKGVARLYLDGKYLTSLNNYAPATAERSVLWTDSFAVPGPHTLTIVNVGTGGSGLGIDGLAKLTS
jgi:hypothetical protein